uniref:Myosin motor domain-containing protein n=1 Tax=Alexandrium monilatum TaxID=311494 RepID=A0A7S4SFA2_9DINO
MDRYWVPHPELVFAPCHLESRGGKDAIFKDPDQKQVTCPNDKVDTLPKVSQAQLVGVENICTLDEVNEAAVLHCVRTRYGKEIIYTNVAKILIAVNPFKQLPIFSAQRLEKYLKGTDSADLPPHIYGTGLDAIAGLRRGDKKNQAVFISGESGAGKTESTKLVLSYVAEALGGSEGGIQDKIMRTNPILEAFGNAMTVRNNNSSRFGKWLQMMVTGSMKVKGCAVVDYLLELTRVCNQGEKERNYHVFFMLIYSRKDELLKSLHIREPQDYNYLKHAQMKAPGVDDLKCFEEIKDALDGLGYSRAVQTEIFSLTMGILALGNIEFKDKNDAANVVDMAKLSEAASLLGVKEEALCEPLLTRKITVGKEVTEATRNASQAQAVRDSLARLMYGRLFKWLIAGINEKLTEGGRLDGQFFGVLDIAGFESFEANSLEQLFINLGNEHLQLFFNNHIFKMELDDYKAEGLPIDSTFTFQDNSDIVTLLDSKGGVLAMLDEEVSMPRATDQTFVSKVLKAHGEHKRLAVPKFAGSLKFGIRHFAGEVTYSAEGFLEKNVDKPPDEAPALCKDSSLSVLSKVGREIEIEVAEANSHGGGKKKKTVSSSFRQSLASLMALVNTAEPHFVRCVKPNFEKVPEKFTSKLVMDQLRSSGVFEAVRIRQSGFASRHAFKEFTCRYRCILSRAAQAEVLKGGGEPAAMTAVMADLPNALSAVGGLEAGGLVVGKTKVFAKLAAMKSLERARDLAMAAHALRIQRHYVGFRLRRRLGNARATFGLMNQWCKDNKFYTAPGTQNTALAKYKTLPGIEASVSQIANLLKEAAGLPMEYPRLEHIKKVKSRMENEISVLRQLQSLAASVEVVDIEAALKRAKGLELEGAGEQVDSLSMRAKKLKVQVPLVKAMTNAMEKKDLAMLSEVMESVRKAGLHTRPEDWVSELKGETIAGEVYNLQEDLKAQRKLEDIEKKRKADLRSKMEEQVHEREAKFQEDDEPKEEPAKVEAKSKRRATITGFSPADQDKVKIGLLAACHEFDVASLTEGLATAAAQGMEDCPPLAQAQELFENLQTEAFLITALEEQAGRTSLDTGVAHAVRCVKNLSDHAESLGLAAEAVAKARKGMQREVRQRARKTIRGDIFFKVDMNELDLVEDAFSDLGKFPGLKPADQWRGHRSFLFMSTETDLPARLKHSKNELWEALTQVPPALEKRATVTFHSLLGWMNDRPMPDSQRLGYAQDIVDAAKADAALGDETYVQVMKQLTANPSQRSECEGWKLMLQLCQQVQPSTELNDFVHTFLLKASRSDNNPETNVMARQCIADLNVITAAEPVTDDAQELIPVQVRLIDLTSRKVLAPEGSTLEQLGERAALQLRITDAKDFCFFQMTEGLEMHRLLPDSVPVATLFRKWDTLQKKTGRSTSLLYKRKLLQVGESLQPGDLMHATLTFRQALWDYLHYPIPEDHPFLIEIAVHILQLSYDHFRRYIHEGTLHLEGVLEQLLPEVSLRLEQNRSFWSTQISQRFHSLRNNHVEETRLVKMSRIFTLLQKMKLFGAYYWMGRQKMEVPADFVSIQDAPQQMVQINQRVPEGWYWICVDLYGVRFVSADCGVGQGFQRGFLYNEEAVERLVCWGAKQEHAMFVVMTVNPALPGAGRVPMTLAVKSPAAMDISYAIHSVLTHLGRLPQ